MSTNLFIRKILVFFFISFSIFCYGDSIYNALNYTIIGVEAVKWSPEENIYFNSLKLELYSDYGKIFYLIDKNLSMAEPIPYTNELTLKGEKGRIVDYNLIVMLEKDDGRVEFFSRTYRIDRIDKFEKRFFQKENPYKKEITTDKTSIKINYQFKNNFYNIKLSQKEFNFPNYTQEKTQKTEILEINGKKGEKTTNSVSITYQKNDSTYTEIENYSINLNKPLPPSFGSLYWGQIYNQNYKIEIRGANKNDKIFYWIREKNKDELLFGPPPITDTKKWIEYTTPVELTTKYGLKGTSGVAAFAVGKNGLYSDIAGPFYFKINGIEKPFQQTFYDQTPDVTIKKVSVNGVDLSSDIITRVNQKVVLKFESFNEDDSFYFTFNSSYEEGKSDLFSCEGEYVFNNNSQNPYEINLFYSNGEKFGTLHLNKDNLLPVLKKFTTNFVDVSTDTVFDFYLPSNNVKYEITYNLNKTLDITENSKEFNGKLKLNVKNGQELLYKVKFGAFNNTDLIAESDYYYFKIDKRNPIKDVSSDGIDFSIPHNEQQILKLIPPEKDSSVYYRFSEDADWTIYEDPIIFYPPLFGQYEINVYVKSRDKVGNERENEEPYLIRFDRRGIFVDNTKKFSGNGTEQAPFKSIERSIYYAKLKNMKIIYLMSDDLGVSFPTTVESDVIIEPYKNNTISSITMDTKSLWKKKHIWFDIFKDGYLEFRNINFDIKSGNYFANVAANKLKIYNCNLSYYGENEFSFIKGENSKIGINNISLNVPNNPDKFNFLDCTSTELILKNINARVNCKENSFFNIKNIKKFYLEKLNYKSDISNSNVFFTGEFSDITIKNLIYEQKGNFKSSNIFDLKNSNFNIEESRFIVEGQQSFDTRILVCNDSQINIKNSQFKMDKSFSMIGFNCYNSTVNFTQGIIDFSNVLDFIYSFRIDKGLFKISNVVIRNSNSANAILVLLNNSSFEGVNNSFFNNNIEEKSFAFWVNEEGNITTVNSLYYFSNQKKSSFIYLNNHNYNAIKPAWYSNAISSNITLLENLDKKDLDFIIKDFEDKNVFYDFKDDFNVAGLDFFIPQKDSPLLQRGIDSSKSPLQIPEKDFYGKNRILSGIGIDIGAVQKSGYLE